MESNCTELNNANIDKLWEEYASTRQAQIREVLINHYIPLVKLVAGRVAISLPPHVDREDLVSVGFLGLMDSIEKFDCTRGVKFETYAYVRIKGTILDSLRAQDWLPASLRQRARQYEKTILILENELSRAPTEAEIAAKMEIDLEELHSIISNLNSSTLIPLEDFTQSNPALRTDNTPLQHIEREDVKSILVRAIDKLPEKERLLVSLYYYEGLTLKEISAIMKLSPARISQLHTMAIYRMRGALSRQKSSIF
ncbi:MAG: FliA/WhiG family RNA polymerase sigma factor [Sporomusaceae bacterium]|nr:FliA/WhiG family RNA polymerase sigma factor [Sporomusaceae bacterium]